MAGAVADGVHIHPLNTDPYLRQTALPELTAGAASAGRDIGDLAVIVPTFAAPGATSDEVQALREMARMQVAFYGSTPNYAFIFEQLGRPGTTAAIREKQKAGDLAGMAAVDRRRDPRALLHQRRLGHGGRRPDRALPGRGDARGVVLRRHGVGSRPRPRSARGASWLGPCAPPERPASVRSLALPWAGRHPPG